MHVAIDSIVQLAVGFVFAAAAVPKLLSPRAFVVGVRNYNILPESIVPSVAVSVMVGEGLVSVAHLSGLALGYVVVLGECLVVMFLAATSIALARGLVIPCYCHGTSSREIVSLRVVVRLVVLLIGEVAVARAIRGSAAFAPPYRFASSVLDMVGGCSLAVLSVEYMEWLLATSDVITLLSRLKNSYRLRASM